MTGVSPLYRTDAWGMPEGTAEFRNAVVSVDTRLSAAELLAGLQRIEASHGRVRTDIGRRARSIWTSSTLTGRKAPTRPDVAASARMAAGFRIGAVACA